MKALPITVTVVPKQDDGIHEPLWCSCLFVLPRVGEVISIEQDLTGMCRLYRVDEIEWHLTPEYQSEGDQPTATAYVVVTEIAASRGLTTAKTGRPSDCG